jgi:hypothetical protein
MRRPSFPTVISLIALFVALGGTSYAVIKLPAKSVGNRELKTNAVTSAKIRPRAVSRSDLAPSARTGTRGPRGPAGPTGNSGDAVAPEAWKALSFSSAWRNYDPAFSAGGYRKDARGRVYLRGLVSKAGGTPAVNEVIATLPSGYRPVARSLFAVGSGVGTPIEVYGRVDVSAGGEVVWMAGGTAEPDFTSLETISFWTD